MRANPVLISGSSAFFTGRVFRAGPLLRVRVPKYVLTYGPAGQWVLPQARFTAGPEVLTLTALMLCRDGRQVYVNLPGAPAAWEGQAVNAEVCYA